MPLLSSIQRRILDISFRHSLSHLGSCLGMAPILDEVYAQRAPDEPVILSAGHAGLALYCALEKWCGKDAEALFLRHGVHPTKNADDGIYCSTGSLGQGLSVAVGRALANRKRNVWCLISDGECAEGVVWESLNFARRHHLDNLRVYCHWNDYAAYRQTYDDWTEMWEAFHEVVTMRRSVAGLDIPFLQGQDAHYYIMKPEDWAWVEANS